MNRFFLLVLGGVVFCGCIATNTPLDFCKEQVRAECERQASCQQADAKSAQDCYAARASSCEGTTNDSLCGAGKTFDPAKAQECVSSYPGTDCNALNHGNKPGACFVVCK